MARKCETVCLCAASCAQVLHPAAFLPTASFAHAPTTFPSCAQSAQISTERSDTQYFYLSQLHFHPVFPKSQFSPNNRPLYQNSRNLITLSNQPSLQQCHG